MCPMCPLVLVHVDEPKEEHKLERLAMKYVPTGKLNGYKTNGGVATSASSVTGTTAHKDGSGCPHSQRLDHIELVDDELRLSKPETAMLTTVPAATGKPKLVQSETLAKNVDDDIEEQTEAETRTAPLRNE